MKLRCLLLSTLLAVSGGCALATPRLPPDGGFEAAEVAAWATAERQGMRGLAPWLSRDALALYPDRELLRGPVAFGQLLASMTDTAALPLRLLPLRRGVSADGSMAWSFGWTERSGGYGKYIAAWSRTGREWRLAALLLAPPIPMSPAEPPPRRPPLVRSPCADPAGSAELAARAATATDRVFAATADSAGTGAAFGRFATEDATMLGGGEPVVGRDAIQRAFDARSRLQWTPTLGAGAGSGDVAFTIGDGTLHYTDAAGNPAQRHSRYLTLWQRDCESGEWRYLADGGVPRPQR